MCVSVNVCVCISECVCVFVNVCMSMNVCVPLCVHVGCVCVFVNVCVCVCVKVLRSLALLRVSKSRSHYMTSGSPRDFRLTGWCPL